MAGFMTPLELSQVKFHSASLADQENGLLGFVSCVLDGRLHLDGITVRRTQNARLTLSFPARTDRRGSRHFLVRPVDDCARREIELRVFRCLGMDPEVPS